MLLRGSVRGRKALAAGSIRGVTEQILVRGVGFRYASGIGVDREGPFGGLLYRRSVTLFALPKLAAGSARPCRGLHAQVLKVLRKVSWGVRSNRLPGRMPDCCTTDKSSKLQQDRVRGMVEAHIEEAQDAGLQ